MATAACIVLIVCLMANPRTDSPDWQPQPEIEDQDEYSEAVEAAINSVKHEEVVVDDKGSKEKTALAWMEAWFDMLKALPEDNMAHISEGAVDHLKIIKRGASTSVCLFRYLFRKANLSDCKQCFLDGRQHRQQSRQG